MGRFNVDRLLNDLGIRKGPEDAVDGEQGTAENAAPAANAEPDSATSSDASNHDSEVVLESVAELSGALQEFSNEIPTIPDGMHDEKSSVPPESADGSSELGAELPLDESPNPAVRISSAPTTPPSTILDDPPTPLTTEFLSNPSIPDNTDDLIDLNDALTPLWTPTEIEGSPGGEDVRDLGAVLLDKGIITAVQLENARSVIKQTPGQTLPRALAEMGIDEEPIQQIVAELYQLSFERIGAEDGFHIKMTETLGVEFCRVNGILPLRRDGRVIVLAMTAVDDVFLLDEIRRKLGGSPIKPVLVTHKDIALALEMKDDEGTDDPALDDLLADIAEDDVAVVDDIDEDDDFEKQAGESPVIRYVNYIIQTALKEGASDIHIEPGETKLKVRFRIDGILFERMNPVAKMHAAIVSRLKIMANLDIAERRMPQDGRIRAVVGSRKIDLRVSTLPTVAGEKCVMRILDSRSISVGLDQLGFNEDTLTIWQHQIAQPHGIILVTGPTGSGKTTTLYSSLREMDVARLNVSTVEDPVEYHLANITQTQIHDKIGFSFASALRSLLRQDPDVVMVGEIRDTETALIAVQASLTGHLVLSTLHTNDAPSSITRLINIGVEPFLIGSALNAVLAQRLVRRICQSCKAPSEMTEDKIEFLTMLGQAGAELSEGSGCDKCRQTGYNGRLGIYELLMLDDSIRDQVAKSPSVTEFRRMCIERGMVTLRHDGMMKVVAGQTTIEEVLRVTESTI